MIDWSQWFEDVIEKAEQLSLCPKLTVKVESKKPEEREIEPRAKDEFTRPHPAAPKRRLTVPPKGPQPPPGDGWRRTPNGWARGQGDSYEWKPKNWAELGAKEPEVELGKEERKTLFDFTKWGQVNIEVAKYKRLVDEGYLEVLERGKEGRPHFGPGNAMVVVSDKGREWIRHDRARRIKEQVRQGKLAHEDVGWAMFAANDAYNQVQQARGGDREAKQAVFERAVDYLYEVEKKHGAIPTTARGVREALDVPKEWSIQERTATGPARMIVISAGDTIMKLNWTKKGPIAYRQWWNHTQGGFWQNIDKKKKPARELIAKELEKQAEFKRRSEKYYAMREQEEAQQAEQDPVVRGEELKIEKRRGVGRARDGR